MAQIVTVCCATARKSGECKRKGDTEPLKAKMASLSEACAQCGQDYRSTLTLGSDRKYYCAECWFTKFSDLPTVNTSDDGRDAASLAEPEAKSAHGKDTTATPTLKHMT